LLVEVAVVEDGLSGAEDCTGLLFRLLDMKYYKTSWSSKVGLQRVGGLQRFEAVARWERLGRQGALVRKVGLVRGGF
jgi:hypothetical protein